jgi:predicted permease
MCCASSRISAVFSIGSDEHGPNSAPYIVLSHAFWHSHFQEDRGVVGRTVQVNKHPLTIVGVAPADFHGTFLPFSPDFFVPIVQDEHVLDSRANRWMFEIIGHLKPGVTPAQAAADLNSIGADLAKTYPKDDPPITYSLARPGLYGNFLGGPVQGFIGGLMLLAGLILLAACANLGSLFAARAADRSREVALRLALGARRGRIVRQLLTEAVLISLSGGAAGLLASTSILRKLSLWQPFPRFPISMPLNPDASVYAVAALLSLASGFLIGAVPLRQVLRTNPYEIVKWGSLGRAGRRITARDALLVVQVAICAVLVTSSLVAVRGLARSMHSNFGFDPHNAILVDTDLAMAGYRGDSVKPMRKRMIDAAAAIPDVTAVGLVDEPPLTLGGNTRFVFTDKTADLRPGNAAAGPYVYMVSPDYFRAAGTTFIDGRHFTEHDDKNSPRVAVVNQKFAMKMFGSVTEAVGRYFKQRDGTRTQVVGVVEDGKYLNLTEDQQAAMFLPMLQESGSETWLVVRSANDPQQLAPVLRRALQDLDAGLPLRIDTWNQTLNGPLFPSEVATFSLGVLGAMGAMLSVTGVFGLAAYSVSKRLRELGIRMALGAHRKEVLRAALERPFKLLALGSAAGLVLGLMATRVLAFIVYQATPRDPLVLTGVVLAMLTVGLLATWIPARRALSIDPLVLLREE